MQAWPLLSLVSFPRTWPSFVCEPYERTKRSRFSHLVFLGLNLINRLKRTWATGAIPLDLSAASRQLARVSYMGAPG